MFVEAKKDKRGKFRLRFLSEAKKVLNNATFNTEEEALAAFVLPVVERLVEKVVEVEKEVKVEVPVEVEKVVEKVVEVEAAPPAPKWPFDLRQTGVFLALDRLFTPFMDRAAYNFLQQAVMKYESVDPKALKKVSKETGVSIAHALAEVQRLGCHVAIVQNRTVNPRASNIANRHAGRAG